jgi:hypothetical protein
MPKPFTPLQAYQNEVFLESLGRSGNVRLSARAAGVRYGTIQHRRSAHADFAQRWEAAVAAVHARLHLAGGKRRPESSERSLRDGRRRPANPLRTQGGEPIVVRTRSGRLQVRLAHPDKLTLEAEQAFLHALSATANVRLSAAAAGASEVAFYRRRRLDPVFAREMRLALKMGWQRLKMESFRAGLASAHGRDRWRNCATAPIPPLSFDQAFQLLCLHGRSVNAGWEHPRRRRRGESDSVHIERLRAMGRVEKAMDEEDEALRRAARFEAGGGWRLEDEPPPPALPPLETVTGWSRAKGGAGRHSGLALFGGWRIGEMERRLAAG